MKLIHKKENRQGLPVLVHACCFLVCRLAPILQDLLSMLTGYIRLVLECITTKISYWITSSTTANTAVPVRAANGRVLVKDSDLGFTGKLPVPVGSQLE